MKMKLHNITKSSLDVIGHMPHIFSNEIINSSKESLNLYVKNRANKMKH
jgi:hypothetical protein